MLAIVAKKFRRKNSEKEKNKSGRVLLSCELGKHFDYDHAIAIYYYISISHT